VLPGKATTRECFDLFEFGATQNNLMGIKTEPVIVFSLALSLGQA
jgi:hypothetical protein